MDFLRHKWITGQLISLLFGTLCLCAQPCHGGISDRTFIKLTSPSYGSERLDAPWPGMSLVGCLTRCLTRYSSRCQSFMYNSQTGLCTPGSFLKSGIFGAALAPTSTEGDLFAPSTCDTSDGFTYVTSSGESACIMVTSFGSNFYGARHHCLSLGAHLFVGRTLEIYSFVPKDRSYIIGMTDLAVEGKMRWEDNGEEVTNTFKKSLFIPGEPNNSNNEDCVYVLFPSSTGILRQVANDAPCNTMQMRFVCERPMV